MLKMLNLYRTHGDKIATRNDAVKQTRILFEQKNKDAEYWHNFFFV